MTSSRSSRRAAPASGASTRSAADAAARARHIAACRASRCWSSPSHDLWRGGAARGRGGGGAARVASRSTDPRSAAWPSTPSRAIDDIEGIWGGGVQARAVRARRHVVRDADRRPAAERRPVPRARPQLRRPGGGLRDARGQRRDRDRRRAPSARRRAPGQREGRDDAQGVRRAPTGCGCSSSAACPARPTRCTEFTEVGAPDPSATA